MDALSRALSALRWIGPGGIWRALRYSRTKARLDQAYLPPRAPETSRPLGPLREARPRPTGLEGVLEEGSLEVEAVLPRLFRLLWGPGPAAPEYGVDPAFRPDPGPVEVREREEGWSVATAALELRLPFGGGLCLRDRQGRVQARLEGPVRRGAGWEAALPLPEGATVHGLGERAAPLDLRGGRYRLWNRDPGGAYGPGDDPLYLTLPLLFLVRRGEGILLFFDVPWPGEVDVGREDPGRIRIRFEGGPLRLYWGAGPVPELLSAYARLTGRPPLPPLWALGYHQSRWSYAPQARVEALVEAFEGRGLPLDAVHLDIDYMDGYRVFTWDRRRFPDLPGLARRLAREGVRLVAIVDPGVKVDPGYGVYRQGHEQGRFCTLPDGTEVHAPVWPGWAAFPDFTDPEVRRWWGDRYRVLLEAGIAGFWNDMNEPAAFVDRGDPTLPLATRHALEGLGGDHRAAHNVYGLLMVRAGYEGVRRLDPQRRPFFLSRSGWAGIQRYAWVWTGDCRSDWAGLRASVATVLNLGLSGIPFVGVDVGGFHGRPSPELFARWVQLGTFLPLFRTHTAAGTPDQEPWSFGPRVEGICRIFLELRYRLLPYLYTLAWEARRTGWPLVRPLGWPDAEDPGLWRVDDAFLLGEALLVAPILEPGAEGRAVPLPPGRWIDVWSGRVWEGPERAELAAPLERIPLLARAGTVLPLAAPVRRSGRIFSHPLTLRLYPPADGEARTSLLYLDEGEGWAHEAGAFRIDRFTLAREGRRLELTWTTEGTYPWPFPAVRIEPAPGLRWTAVRVEGGTGRQEGEAIVLEGPAARVEVRFS